MYLGVRLSKSLVYQIFYICHAQNSKHFFSQLIDNNPKHFVKNAQEFLTFNSHMLHNLIYKEPRETFHTTVHIKSLQGKITSFCIIYIAYIIEQGQCMSESLANNTNTSFCFHKRNSNIFCLNEHLIRRESLFLF